MDKRTYGARRRQETVTKATDLITPMLERALRAGINAKYVFMDSWFGVPSLIAKAREHLHVIHDEYLAGRRCERNASICCAKKNRP